MGDIENEQGSEENLLIRRQKAVEAMRESRQGQTLGNLDWKELRDEGRRPVKDADQRE